MNDTTAVHPMSREATSAANDEFYSQHPEMVKAGKRIPIDSQDPNQSQLRRDWMQAYEKNGGTVEKAHPKKKAAQVRKARAEAKAQNSSAGTAVAVVHCPAAKAAPPNTKAIAQAPKPDKPDKPCKLVTATYSCEHGRLVGDDGVLCVVPDSYASIGDKITCKAKILGGCGDHVEWSIGGVWTSTEQGTNTEFIAKTFKPATLAGWLLLHTVSPQTYRVNATACEGGVPSLEVQAYPPDKRETKIDFTKIREAIHKGFKLAPINEEKKLEVEFLQIAISCEEQWKEDEESAKAYCECKASGGVDPLVKLERAFPIYPLSLIPAGLEDYVKAGFYITLGGEIGFTLAWIGKYWADTQRWQHDKFQVELSGEIEGKLSANLYLVSKDVLNIEIAGVTSFTGAATASTGDDPAIELELLWGGLQAVITLEAVGFFEYKRTYPILEERVIEKKEYPLGGGESDSAEEE